MGNNTSAKEKKKNKQERTKKDKKEKKQKTEEREEASSEENAMENQEATANSCCCWEELPIELWIHIMSYLNGPDIYSSLLINKQMYQASIDDSVWKLRFLNAFPSSSSELISD